MESNLIVVMFRRLLEALRIRSGPEVSQREISSESGRSEPFSIVLDGNTIRGTIRFPAAIPARQYPGLIICHGIPGSGAARPSNDPGYDVLAHEFSRLGLAVVTFNFRGCGDSGGNFDMMGWPRDLDGVIDKIVNTPYVDPTRILVLGFSGGGAASIYVGANSSSIYGLAVVGTPANFSIFKKNPDEIIADFRERGLFRDHEFPDDVDRWMTEFEEIEPLHWVSQFQGKHLLIVHGDSDELIPVEQARELFKKAPAGVSELSIIPRGVHRLRLDPRCIEILSAWFLKILGWKS